MVEILEFHPPEPAEAGARSTRKTRGLPEGHSAEIIIFPGVRIERPMGEGGDDKRVRRAGKGTRRPAGGEH